MQNKNGFSQLWRILYPWLLYDAIRYIVNMIILNVMLMNGMNAAEVVNRYPQINLVLTLVSALVTLPVVLWLYQKDEKTRNIRKSSEQTINRRKAADWAAIVITSITACIGLNQLVRILAPVLLTENYKKAAQALYADNGILQIAVVVIVVPVLEELIFRGLIFRRLREWKGFFCSAVVNAVVFGVYHGNLYQGVYAFLVAVIFCIVYETYNSIQMVMLMHCCMNAVSLTGTKLGIFQIQGVTFVAVFAGTAVIMVGTVIWIWNRNENKELDISL